MKPNDSSTVELRFRSAFESLRERMAALREDELQVVNVDITDAVRTVLGTGDKRALHREAILAENPTYDMHAFDNIETYAMAANFAHARHLAASAPPEPIAPLEQALAPLYETLREDLKGLRRRGLIDAPRIARGPGRRGVRRMSNDTLRFVTILRTRWDDIHDKTPVTLEELDKAESLAERLACAVGLKEHGAEVRVEATQTRQRAFTLLSRAYDEVRRIVQFARWHHKDADAIAPSFFAKRGRRRKPTEPKSAPSPVTNHVVPTADDLPAPFASGDLGARGFNGEEPFDA